MMKARELREMSDVELEAKLEELKKELFKLRIERSIGQVANPMRRRDIRRDIARIKTILNERRRGQQSK